MREAWTQIDVLVMQRCFALARRGGLAVKSNPMVGCVITHNDHIIAEGYHRRYGANHAERDALANLQEKDKHLLATSHMYVSLEPCGHHGKTPPCVDAILEAGIPQVTIACVDPTDKLQGKSVILLRDAGVIVRIDLLEEEGRRLITPFIAHHIHARPYIILKWAQSGDRFMGAKDRQVWLSNEISKYVVHEWRSQIDGILIGTDTAITDNPTLNNRLAPGTSPHRYVLDRQGRLPQELNIARDDLPTTFISSNGAYKLLNDQKQVVVIPQDQWNLPNILHEIYREGCHHLMIEGGASLLKSFISEDLWDEARIIYTDVQLTQGIKSPMIKGVKHKSYKIDNNNIMIISRL